MKPISSVLISALFSSFRQKKKGGGAHFKSGSHLCQWKEKRKTKCESVFVRLRDNMVAVIKGLEVQSELMKWSLAFEDVVQVIHKGCLAQNER